MRNSQSLTNVYKEVRSFISQEKLFDAINYYKEANNCTFIEAKYKVNIIIGKLPSNQNSRCAYVIVILIVFAGTILMFN